MQRRLFEIRRSSIDGRGAFALRRIPKGTRIVEYTGDRISPSEADRRQERKRSERTYFFTVNSRVVIDASHRGSRARFINHSCEPNCASTVEKGRVYIEAVRDIEPGEELSYDYRLVIDGSGWRESGAEFPCYCGTANCRHTLLYVPKRSLAEARRELGARRNGAPAAAPRTAGARNGARPPVR